ncbi:MAG: hypothetical protein KDI13_06575 [Alphaproteobacteria bacterium]|nr:hypothetical protein [Alphaproteobacteria bacterium]
MANLELGKDYVLRFNSPYDSEEDKARLTAFVQNMFERVPLLAERVHAANQLHTQPVSIVFADKALGARVEGGEAFSSLNRIYLNPDGIHGYGVLDREKGCVVQHNVALVVGHELYHLGDPTFNVSLEKEWPDYPNIKALNEYLQYQKDISKPPEERIPGNTPAMSDETISLVVQNGWDVMTGRELEKILAEKLTAFNQFQFNYVYDFEMRAAQSEHAIEAMYPEGVIPRRDDYMNFYKQVDGDQALQLGRQGVPERLNSYPERAKWCDDAHQPDVYSLPTAPAVLKP